MSPCVILMQKLPRLGLVFRLHLVGSGRNPVEEAGDGGERDSGQRRWFEQAFPDVDEGANARLVRQARIERRPVGVVQNVHDMRAANAWRIVEAGICEAARLEVGNPLSGPFRHGAFRAKQDCSGRACLDASRFQTYADPVRAQGALVRLMIDLADPWDVERAAFDAVAAADAVLADEIDDAVGVLHNRTRGWARL